MRDIRVGVDIGGTFTDLCVADADGVLAVGKTLTTPRAPAEAVETVIRDTLALHELSGQDVAQVVHATTLVTNALIERNGAPTALFASAGFRDVLELGRERRADLYDLSVGAPKPLIPRHLRFGVPERTLSDGSIEEALDVARVERLAGELRDSGVEAVAVAFLNSFANPANERRARDAILRAAPNMQVALSSEVVPEVREYERTTTTAASIYVQERVARYLADLERRLAALDCGGRLRIMLSNGGVATAASAARHPIRLLESGPAAGALGAASFGGALGHRDLLSFDMGGTTAKLCLVENGRPLVTHDFEVDRTHRLARGSGMPVKTPVIDMIEIGVGGGSVARVTALGLLAVGPESAGAEPGPACYGRGGVEPTITDADLVLGYLDPGFFLGGRMALDADAAREAIERKVAQPMGLGVEEAAWGIHRLANEDMAAAARVHAAERGHDPTGLMMFAFGGAGPVHACGVATALGCASVAVPTAAGVMASMGVLAAPLVVDAVRSRPERIDDGIARRVEVLLDELRAENEELLIGSGVELADIEHELSADMRYVGQGFEVAVVLSRALGAAQEIRQKFERAYERKHGRRGPEVPIEAVNWRLISRGPVPGLRRAGRGGSAPDARKGSRPAWFDGQGLVETPVYDRYAIEADARIEGPAVIEERESTVVVPLGATAVNDPRAALIVDLPERS